MMIGGAKFYYGVVESRADPLKLGRCKVRVMGIHTENTVLLPTKDLPWAFPLQPITSAGVSGIGFSPTGPVEGTWVVCFFRDEGSFQEPIMLGTLGGIPEDKAQKLSDPYSGTAGTRYEGLKDLTSITSDEENSKSKGEDGTSDSKSGDADGNASGEGGTSGSSSGTGSKGASGSSGSDSSDSDGGDGVRTGNVLNQVESAKIPSEAEKSNYKVGEITGKHESNGRIDAINDYRGKASGDLGGASYGKYQLASYMGADGPKSNRANNSPVKRFVDGSPYKQEFAGLVPGTQAFDKKWKEVAAKDPKGFEDAQRQYIVDNNYSPTLNGLRKDGIDLTNRGPAVQEMIFSTGTQYGSGRPIKRALAGKDVASMTDAEIVQAVQDDKIKNIDKDFRSSSQNIRNGVKKRAEREKARLTEIAGKDSAIDKDDVEAIRKKQNPESDSTEESTTSGSAKPIPASGVTEARTIEKNDTPGFQDPFSVYPRKKWINEQDTSRLARNEKIDQTIMKAKDQTRVKKVSIAGGKEEPWDEPKSPYNAKYPLNHVYQSESGHTVEYDDTPGAERIHFYHRSGSFIEWHPDGKVIYKCVEKQFEVTVDDRNIYVGGNCNITVVGDTNIYTKGVLNMESDGDMTIKTQSNLFIGAEGQAIIMAEKDMHVGSLKNMHCGAKNIFLNCSWYPYDIKAGDYFVGKVTVEVYDDDEDVPVQSASSEEGAINAGKEDGSIPTDGSPPSKQPDGTMKSTQTKPDPEMDKLEKSEPDKKETKCPGEDAKGSDELSTNYRLADLTTSPVLSKVALKEQAGLTKCEIFDNLSALAKNVLEPIRARYGSEFIITSAFRSMGSNGASQHPKGQAVDIQFPGLSKDQYVHRIEEISRIVSSFDQMILEYHGRNPVIHISYNSNGNRGQKKSTPNLRQYYSGFRDSSMGLVYS